ncbi:MAG: dockerin type I repeat-containing protein [Prevotella sp.]|nr:dockerin type I repeat-containing protein [Prevotella sp.]
MRYKRIIWLLVLLVQLATLTIQAQTSISLTDNDDGTWGLAQMPAYNVRMEVEYESSQTIALTDNGDGTWGTALMPAYNVRMEVEYETPQTIDLTEDLYYGTWETAQMPAYNVRMVVEYEDLIPKPGDVNCDGRVNIADVVAIVNYIKGETPPVFNEEKADVSGNGRVTVDDLMIIVNVIMLNK